MTSGCEHVHKVLAVCDMCTVEQCRDSGVVHRHDGATGVRLKAPAFVCSVARCWRRSRTSSYRTSRSWPPGPKRACPGPKSMVQTVVRSRSMRVAALILGTTWLLVASSGWARGVYPQPEEFLREVFAGRVPPPQVLWLTEARQRDIERILGHRYPSLRLRYWAEAARSAWILEEIGKEEPITVGIVVNDKRIELVRVLVFRESRGDEVRHGFFTDQFKGAALESDMRLDRPIDGISGATLSVRAVTKLARLGLYLHAQAVR